MRPRPFRALRLEWFLLALFAGAGAAQARGDDSHAAASTARALENVFASALASHVSAQVTTEHDVEAALSVKAQRELLGCEDEARCLLALSDLLDVRYVVTADVSRVGPDLVARLSCLDGRGAKLQSSMLVEATSLTQLMDQLERAARSVGAGMEDGERVFVRRFRVDESLIASRPGSGDGASAASAEDRERRRRALVEDLRERLASVVPAADVTHTVTEGGLALGARVGALEDIILVSVTVVDPATGKVESRRTVRVTRPDEAPAAADGLARQLVQTTFAGRRVTLAEVEVEPAAAAVGEGALLGAVPVAIFQWMAGTALVTFLTLVPGVNCVLCPFIPTAGALVQVALGNAMGTTRSELFWPVVLATVASLPALGLAAALGSLSLMAGPLLGLRLPTTFPSPLLSENLFGVYMILTPFIAFAVWGVVAQTLTTTVVFMGSTRSRTETSVLGLTASARRDGGERAPSSPQLVMAY